MDVPLFESAALALCTASDKTRAEETLNSLLGLFETASSPSSPRSSNAAVHLSFYERYLEQVSSPYAQFILFSRLKALLSSKFSVLSNQELLDSRNFILRFLSSKPDLENFVHVIIYQTFGVLTVLAWFLGPEFQSVHEDVSKFLSATLPFQREGMELLNATVIEMNYASSSVKTLPKHRKIAVSFRDSQLLPIFTTGLSFLNHILSQASQGLSSSKVETRLQEVTLNLLKNCLSFDFIGINPDEASDDISSAQIPLSWKEKILDPSTMESLYQSFLVFKDSVKSKALECLSILASTRRSLFTDEEKLTSLTRILGLCLSVIQHLQTDAEGPENHHEFSRLLARVKHVYQANEMLADQTFSSFSTALTAYTIDRLKDEWELNTLTYLFTFWSKLASSTPHAIESRSSVQLALAQEVHVIFTAFSTKMDSESGVEEIRTFLQEEDDLCLFLELVAPLVRTNYEAHAQLLEAKIKYWIPQYESYFRALSPGRHATVVENEQAERIATVLSFCIYVCGAVVGARTPYESTEDQDFLDGVLAATILQMMNQLGQYTRFVHEKLELAFLNFVQQFRKVYIGESTHRASKVYKRLSEMLHLRDQNEVLEAIVQKIESNLRYCSHQPRLMDQSLNLFVELSNGYSSVRNLRRSETVKLMLSNDPSNHFPFLETAPQSKNRTKYYAALARILFSGDVEVHDADFNKFVQPFTVTLKGLSDLQDPNAFSRPQIRDVAEGLFRDLRGFVSGCLSKKAYMLFFDWFFPYFDLIHRLFEANFQERICIVILRFVTEFVSNVSSRLSFDISSPNGVLLFQRVSRLLTSLGQLLRQQPEPASGSVWQNKYKKVLLFYEILKHTLLGRYVPFGVFRIFNDLSLDRALDVFFQMIWLVPENDLLSYTKLSASFFSCLCALSGEQMLYMTNIEKPALEYIVGVCASAIKSEAYISSQACSTIDNLISFVIKQGAKPHYLSARFSEMENAIHMLHVAIWEVVLLNEPENLWSLSRPLFPLILVDQAFFLQYAEMLCTNQPPEHQQKLTRGLMSLMDGVQGTLTAKNRDRFTQNVQNFRRDLSNEHIVLS